MTSIMHSNIIGEGRPLVILHGFLGMGDNWISLARRWAQAGFQIHLPDLRNHGKSFHSEIFDLETLKNDLQNYIEYHQLKKPVLAGHSLGGKIVMLDAQDLIKNRSRYIVFDIAPRFYPVHHRFIFEAIKKIDLSSYTSRKNIEKDFIKLIGNVAIARFILKNLKRQNTGKWAWKFNWPVLEKNMEKIGSAIPGKISNVPILFLRGDKSPYINNHDWNEIKKIFPKSEIKTVPGAGHWLHADNPAFVYQTVLDYLTKTN